MYVLPIMRISAPCATKKNALSIEQVFLSIHIDGHLKYGRELYADILPKVGCIIIESIIPLETYPFQRENCQWQANLSSNTIVGFSIHFLLVCQFQYLLKSVPL